MAIKPTVISQEPITMAELKDMLKKREKETDELNFRAARAYDFLKGIKTLPKSTAEELKKNLEKLNIPRLKEHHIKKIIDILPQNETELDIIFYGMPLTIQKDSKKKIIETIKPYLEK